jgi:FHA domain
MLQPVSVGLKFAFLIVLYLFLFWVATSALFDLRRGRARGGGNAAGDTAGEATSMYATADPLAAVEGIEPRLVVEQAAGHRDGVAYDLSTGATLGRGDVEIRLEDPFASSHHAKISRQGRTLVIEDLGSTNGTYLNDEPLTGPRPLHAGDRIRIGDSEFTYFQ